MRVFAKVRDHVLEDRNFKERFSADKEYQLVTNFEEEIGNAEAKVGLIDDHGGFIYIQTQSLIFRIEDDIGNLEFALLSLLSSVVARTSLVRTLEAEDELKKAGGEQNRGAVSESAVDKTE